MSHRTSLIIRLVVLCVSFFLVLGIFLTLFLGGSILAFLFTPASGNALTQPGEVYHFTGVNSLDAALANAHIVVEEADVEEIRVTDNSIGNMRHELFTEGGRLYLRTQRNAFSFFNFSRNSSSGGSFLVEVPSGQALEYTVSTVNGDITLNAAPTDDMQVETVSGDILVLHGGHEFDAETVSGNIEVRAAFEELSLDTVSGESALFANAETQEMQLSSVSGDFYVELADIPGCHAELDSLSGDIENHYDTITLTDGNASLKIEADSVSGRLILENWR